MSPEKLSAAHYHYPSPKMVDFPKCNGKYQNNNLEHKVDPSEARLGTPPMGGTPSYYSKLEAKPFVSQRDIPSIKRNFQNPSSMDLTVVVTSINSLSTNHITSLASLSNCLEDSHLPHNHTTKISQENTTNKQCHPSTSHAPGDSTTSIGTCTLSWLELCLHNFFITLNSMIETHPIVVIIQDLFYLANLVKEGIDHAVLSTRKQAWM